MIARTLAFLTQAPIFQDFHKSPSLRQILTATALSFVFGARIMVGSSSPALPSGGSFTAGAGTVSSSGNSLIVNQTTGRGIIDWKTFSIGQSGLVQFNNGSGATLNRVTGGQMSSILGSLVASGSIYLINPAGVLVGPKGSVKTGGDFLASTLNISNAAFLKGGALVFEGNSTAFVKNLGTISSSGGSIFLIAHSVENDGNLHAPKGTAGLGGGQQILLKDSSSDERVFVQAGSGDILNTGSIASAEAELKAAEGNIYALAGNNGGQIRATGTAERNGHVWLIAGNGTADLSGIISARNADGTGGAIETSRTH